MALVAPTAALLILASALCVQAGAPPPILSAHQGSVASTYSEGVRGDRADFLKNWLDIVTLIRHNASLLQGAPDYAPELMQPEEDNVEVPWNCNPISPSTNVPKSVHALRPGDIKIIGALGDSITAGMGIRSIPGKAWTTFFPNNGESFSVGGERSLEEGTITLANILRKFNPDVLGASYCMRVRQHKYTGFNVAIPGDTSRGMESQARDLINRLAAHSLDTFYNAWKIVTLLIGGNDLCQNCLAIHGGAFTAENYTMGIKAALDLMHAHLPRTFVNVMIMNDVSVVKELVHPGYPDLCDTLHGIECACAMNQTRSEMRALQLNYYRLVNNLVLSGVYDTRDDFTVVVQPFLRDQDPLRLPNGKYDMSFIGPDCFHPGVKAHQAFAVLLWNNMFVPVGKKPFQTDFDTVPFYHCPTEREPYICTSKNCGTVAAP